MSHSKHLHRPLSIALIAAMSLTVITVLTGTPLLAGGISVVSGAIGVDDTRSGGPDVTPVSSSVSCTKSWAGPVSGAWNDGSKWSPPGVPATADSACIQVDGVYTVTQAGTNFTSELAIGAAGNAGIQTLTINGDFTNLATLDLDSGVLAVNGSLTLTSSGIFNANKGTINGTIDLINTPLTLNEPDLSGNAIFKMHGRQADNSVSGDIPAGYTLWVNSPGGDYSYVTAAQGFTNYGTILLDSPGSDWATTLTVTAGTLSNMGTITVGETGVPAFGIAANIDNHGTFELEATDSLTPNPPKDVLGDSP